ncbi:MAG: hypothetical protein JNJ88_01670 [Planctomycetes bacterium]|nr:hypothetical protein [Planctomycetota bacterium]
MTLSLLLDGGAPSGWLAVFGRLHPAILHLPIGLLAAAALVELTIWFFGGSDSRRAPMALIATAALSAILAASTGLVLHEEGHTGEAVETHEQLGIAVAVLASLAAAAHARFTLGKQLLSLVLYRVFLAAAVIVLIPAGHFGGNLTHGENFLFEPLEERQAPAASNAPAGGGDAASPADLYASQIAPILASRCAGCHGEEQQKGKLALHTPEGIARGGKSGALFSGAKPAESLLLARVKLGLEEKGHMPPKSKPQPTEAELAALEKWILAGAPMGASGVAQGSTAVAPAEPKEAAPAAIEALRAKLVHVQPIAQGSPYLWVDFAAPASRTTDSDASALLEPVTEQVAELSLARTKITQSSLALVARMPHLRRLDLRATELGDAALAALGKHGAIEELILAQTKVTDGAVETILALPKLTKLFVWGSAMTADGVARLRRERPELLVDDGAKPDAEKKEVEATPKVGTQPPAAAAGAAPQPVNTTCPVSGQPVNPKFQIVFEGRVIGFCCQNCPGKFWANPEEFRSKLP